MRIVVCTVIVMLVLALAGVAQANVAVVESWVGDRPEDAELLLAPLLAELAAQPGYWVGPKQLGQRVNKHVSGPGRTLTPEQLKALDRKVNRGFDAFLRARFKPAIKDLTSALVGYRWGQATIARDQAHRNLMHKALVGLALAHKRLGHVKEATRAMADLILSFPERGVERSFYGPEAVDLYRRVKSALDERRRGFLRVEVDDIPTAVIFINERYVSVGSAVLPDARPGRYRIYVQSGKQAGRVRDVVVAPNQQATVAIPWALDTVLRSQDFVGLVFANEAARQKNEARFAISVAQSIDASGVVLIGVRKQGRRRALVGTVLSLDTGKPLRSAQIAIEPVRPSAEQIRGLARFLSGGDPDPGLTVTLGADHAASPAAARPLLSRRAWQWTALGTGTLALGLGATLVAIDGTGTCDLPDRSQCDSLRNTRWPGIGLVTVGAALIGTGAYLWIQENKESRSKERPGVSALSLSPTPGGALFVVGGTF